MLPFICFLKVQSTIRELWVWVAPLQWLSPVTIAALRGHQWSLFWQVLIVCKVWGSPRLGKRIICSRFYKYASLASNISSLSNVKNLSTLYRYQQQRPSVSAINSMAHIYDFHPSQPYWTLNSCSSGVLYSSVRVLPQFVCGVISEYPKGPKSTAKYQSTIKDQ